MSCHKLCLDSFVTVTDRNFERPDREVAQTLSNYCLIYNIQNMLLFQINEYNISEMRNALMLTL